MTRDIPTDKLDTWLMQLVHDEISAGDLKELESAMADDLAILDYCLEYLILTAGLEWIGRESEKENPATLAKTLKRARGARKSRVIPMPQFPAQWAKHATRLAAVLLVGLAVGYLLFSVTPSQQDAGLAQVINGLAAKWDDASLTAMKGNALGHGQHHLREGLVEIELASGVQVVLKGPCRFSLPGENNLGLTSGMVAVDVPNKAQGFQVITPWATVTDYGTEFGLIAHDNGDLETHVFSGSVLIELLGGKTTKQIPIPAGIAAKFAKDKLIKKIAANVSRFVKEIPSSAGAAVPGKRFNLADVVGIGNGYGTGTLGCGINPDNGEVLRTPIIDGEDPSLPGYIFLLNWRYVDGVFVPDPSAGDVAVSSQGHVFENCPRTRGGAALGINNGAWASVPGGRRAGFKSRLGGQRFGTADRPAIGLHPNAGITFDLDRIRADNPPFLNL